MSAHRMFRCTGRRLKRGASDLTTLDEQTPETFLQWELVPIKGDQCSGLDDDEHRDHHRPKGGPRVHSPSQVKEETFHGPEKREMDQIERKAGHPQPVEPRPTQMSREKTASIRQTEDEEN